MTHLNKKEMDCAREIIEKLSQISNNMSFNNEDFAKELANNFRKEHRTLQQGIIKVLAVFIAEVSTFSTDLRNEAAVQWCKKVSEIEAIFPFI
jgi:hypothetical protein